MLQNGNKIDAPCVFFKHLFNNPAIVHVMSIASTLSTINKEILLIKQKYPLSAPRVTLLGASKSQSAEAIETAIQAGLTVFGENRVQEAESKWPDIKKRYPNIELHLIGPLQTNKVRAALPLFDVIQTLDRPKLAEVLSAELGVQSKKDTQHSALKTQYLYIQINTGEEPQKAGVLPKEADDFIRYCTVDLKLPVVGLMCIPPADQPPAPHFALLRKIAEKHGLSELSMGMSEDYETAIRMGSTCIRLGRKLFGERSG